ncbi:hypothetical protein I7I48_08301 [Histoplasma ohiense]|nr:hypothetical protein I7I48_08301 [Histoplasma ohiense (nom. inval.)]
MITAPGFGVSKPDHPYVTGNTFIARSHIPPPPIHETCNLTKETRHEREEMHPLNHCLIHSPIGGSDGPVTVDLKIVKTVRVRDNESAQLAVVQIQKVAPSDFLPTDLNLVAKIYDPLYFSHIQDDVDHFLCVDRDYSRETATYTALSKSNLPGTVIPRYFGS